MCFVLIWEKQQLMSLLFQDLHLNFHSFLGFQHGSDSSVKAIMRLSATLPLAIGLKCFWFLIALLLYPKSTILGLSFLDPKDLCLPNQFSRGSWQKHSVSTYLTWCQRRNWVASMIELKLIYNPLYVCRSTTIYEHFLASISFKVSLAFLNRIQPILEELQENITKPWQPSVVHWQI